ncbi:MAG: hypothetical protein Q9175_003641 [Cornicularia normoerica]
MSPLPIRPGSKAAVTRPDTPVASQSVFPATRGATNPHGKPNRAAPIKRKRKRRVSNPTDAIEIGAKRLRGLAPATAPAVTEHAYAPTAPETTAGPSGPTGDDATTQDISTVRWIPVGCVD